MAKKKPKTDNIRKIVIDAILDKKGHDLVSLDLRKIRDTPSDFFIITHGDSSTQVRAIYNSVIDAARAHGVDASHHEGSKNSEWIIIDFFDVVVHIFYREKRDFYALEDLWNDAKATRYKDGKEI